MTGLVAGLVQAAARHVGAGIAARAAHHARPLAPGDALDGEGAAAVQPDLGTQRAVDGHMPRPCPHGRQRRLCKECGGSSICEHGRQRSRCKDCGGSSICEHGRQRYSCKECGGSSQETILLDVTAVEIDEDAEPDEWIPTVQSHIVVAARPLGGKRKR